MREGVPSVTPADSVIESNFIIANYNSQEAIDNDDCSEYMEHRYNFFVYGQSGLKSYFGGHDIASHDNIYAFTIGHCVNIGFGHETFLPGVWLACTRSGLLCLLDGCFWPCLHPNPAQHPSVCLTAACCLVSIPTLLSIPVFAWRRLLTLFPSQPWSTSQVTRTRLRTTRAS